MFIQINHMKINRHHIKRSFLYINSTSKGGVIALSYHKLDHYTHKVKTYDVPLRLYDNCKSLSRILSIAKGIRIT